MMFFKLSINPHITHWKWFLVLYCVFFIIKFSVSWLSHHLIYFYTLSCYANLLLLLKLLLLLFLIIFHSFCFLLFGLCHWIWIFTYLLIYYVGMLRLTLHYFGWWCKLIQIINWHASFRRLADHLVFFIRIFWLIR